MENTSHASWPVKLDVANSVHATEELVTVARRLYRLHPAENGRNRYAIVLLSLRRDPETAVALTLQSLLNHPDPMGLKLNHAHALILNHRLQEAAHLLGTIRSYDLTRDLFSAHQFLWLEIEFQEWDFPRAIEIGRQIDPARLLPGDRKRFQEILGLLAQYKRPSNDQQS